MVGISESIRLNRLIYGGNKSNASNVTVGDITIVIVPVITKPTPQSIDANSLTTPPMESSTSINLTITMIAIVVVLFAVLVFVVLFRRKRKSQRQNSVCLTKSRDYRIPSFDTNGIRTHFMLDSPNHSPQMRDPSIVLGALGHPDRTADRILDMWISTDTSTTIIDDESTIRVSSSPNNSSFKL